MSEQKDQYIVVNMMMNLDEQTGQAVQFTGSVLNNAPMEEIAALLAKLREAGWQEIIATNKRKALRQHLLVEEQEARIKEARDKGKHLNAKRIDQERMERDKETIIADAIVAADERTAAQLN